jgi:PKD repeat protein
MVGETVIVSGEQSYDPDATASGAGPVNAYLWSLVSKPVDSNLQLTDATLAQFEFVADAAGNYVFELVVNDGVQDSVADSVTITASASGNNLPPIPDIQIDQVSGVAPLTVNVSAAATIDPEGDALTYAWDFADPNADITNPNSSDLVDASHTYTLPGSYTVTLSVTDSQGNSAQSSVTVTVSAQNHEPTLAPSADIIFGNAPLLVNFSANAQDADGDSLSYSWNFDDASALQSGANPSHVFQQPGTYHVTVTVSDGLSSVSASITIVVIAPDHDD